MKNIKLLSLLVVLASGSFLLSNCTGTDTPDPVPVIEFIGGGDYVADDISLAGDEDFTVGINATHTKKLASLKISVSYDGGPALIDENCTLCDTILDDNSLRVDFTGTTSTNAGTEVWTFTVADGDGLSTSKTITITNLGTGGSSLIEFTQDNNSNPFRVYNFIGPNSGAYDLLVGSNLVSTDDNNDKDIQDSISVADGTTWPGRWTSRNGTLFKTVSGYTWSTVTNSSQLSAAWDAGSSQTDVLNIVDGAYYMAKLRGTETLVFIEITDLVSTPADNVDYVQFRYKKAP